MRIGVVALQGAFIEHEHALGELGVETCELRCLEDLNRPFDRLVLPGGESTVQGRLLREEGILEPLRERIAAGMPTLGTCAGLILLAEQVEGEASHLATLPVAVRRNAYGRQLASFHTTQDVAGVGKDVPMTFIRAPFVTEVCPGVEVLAKVDGDVVAVRYASQLALSFHPELDRDTRLYELFLSL